MNKSRLELKVGLFVLIALVLLAVLLMQFTKGLTFFQDTYQLKLHAVDVGGLKTRAQVLMSGVPIGTVSEIQLAPDGKSVLIYLKVFSNYIVYSNATFAIEASGFLGDQYVAVKQPENPGGRLPPDSDVTGAEPLNIQEVARSAAGFIKRVDEAARKLDDAISDVRRLLLNEQNLTNLSATVNSLRVTSDRARRTVDEINTLVATNAPMFTASTSNLVEFSRDLTRFSGSLNEILTTNGASLSTAVKNIEDSSATLKDILDDAHAGKGLAGTLLHNEQVAANATEIVNNLSITSSNVNRLGLWRVLFPKPPRATNAPSSGQVQSPKGAAR